MCYKLEIKKNIYNSLKFEKKHAQFLNFILLFDFKKMDFFYISLKTTNITINNLNTQPIIASFV